MKSENISKARMLPIKRDFGAGGFVVEDHMILARMREFILLSNVCRSVASIRRRTVLAKS